MRLSSGGFDMTIWHSHRSGSKTRADGSETKDGVGSVEQKVRVNLSAKRGPASQRNPVTHVTYFAFLFLFFFTSARVRSVLVQTNAVVHA